MQTTRVFPREGARRQDGEGSRLGEPSSCENKAPWTGQLNCCLRLEARHPQSAWRGHAPSETRGQTPSCPCPASVRAAGGTRGW